jgi:hypothetical protein
MHLDSKTSGKLITILINFKINTKCRKYIEKRERIATAASVCCESDYLFK